MDQIIISCKHNYDGFLEYIRDNNIENIFIVCTKSIKKLKIYKELAQLEKKIKITYYMNFKPNPTYDSVVEGIKCFKRSEAKVILAVGGGSAMDVAKCIKLYSNLNESMNYLEQKIIPNNLVLMVMPTTAGTGSEATEFAVIYYKGEKKSISDNSIIPNVVIFDYSTLETLPLYQKKAAMLDALMHSLESYWSVNATEESKKYSLEALSMIKNNIDKYLRNNKKSLIEMQKASYIAGKAINISKTTAGHAMCYKLTSLYGIAHGHAAAIVDSELFPYMYKINKKMFDEIINVIGSENYIRDLLNHLNLYDVHINKSDLDFLVNSVNTERLQNNPISLSKDDIKIIYEKIFYRIEEYNNESRKSNKNNK